MRAEAFPLLIDLVGPGLPPAYVFFGAALLVLVLRSTGQQRAVNPILLLTPLIGFWNLTGLDTGVSSVWQLLDLELMQLRVDRLSLLFGVLFHIGALIGVIYALQVRDTLQHVAALTYVGSALGCVFAGDLVTLFICWEGMALASAFLVWARRTPAANGSGLRYLAMHLMSGLLLLAGTVLYAQERGTTSFDLIGTDAPGGWLILIAFGIKCGFPLLHTWITDAYPRATATGTVFLSMFTSKVAVYALARAYPGTEILIPIGTLMAVFPIFYAVIENDLRRVLGYSMINQIGFIVVGIGIGTELSLNGAVAHAFNEVLFKGLLFMTMGAVLLRVGHVLGSDLGGLYRSMPATTTFCLIGAASISAFPLFSGFVSKSMIMAAMVEHGYAWQWLALLFASAGVFHHAGIKIPYFAFFAHDSGLRVEEAPWNMLLAMGLAALLCVVSGSFPAVLYALLPWEVEYVPYTYPHVVAQLQLLLFSALAFAWLKLAHIYPAELRSVNLDADWIYRRLLPSVAAATTTALTRLRRSGIGAVIDFGEQLATYGERPSSRMRGTAAATLWVSGLLAGYLLMYFFIA